MLDFRKTWSSDEHAPTVEFAQAYVSTSYDNSAALFIHKIIDSQEFVYICDRKYLRKILNDHMHPEVLPESRIPKTEYTPDIVQCHALKQLRSLMVKFDGKLDIIHNYKFSMSQLRQRLYCVSKSAKVLGQASQLVPYLGRFPDSSDIPYYRMYWNRRDNQTRSTGIHSKWYVNMLLQVYARFIQDYDPNVMSKVFHLM